MSEKRDEVDVEEARKLAWSRPGDVQGRPARLVEGDAFSITDDRAIHQLAWRVANKCKAVRAHLDVLAGLKPDTPARSASVEALLTEIAGLDVELVGFRDEPEAPRLVRLYIEGRLQLPVATRRAAFLAILRGVLVDLPPLADPDLLVEAARSEEFDVTSALLGGLDATEASPRFARAGRELSRLLEDGTPQQRLLAALLLETGKFPSVTPALRSGLRSRDPEVRCLCLRALNREAGALQQDDVRFLFDDAVAHGIDWRRTEQEDDLAADYEGELLRAVAPGAPPGIAAAAEAIVATRWTFRTGLDWRFGLKVQALVDPERALPAVDELLAAEWTPDRLLGLTVVERLPEALAKPRLLDAATQRFPDGANRAREIWLERFGEPCPAPRGVGVLASLLKEAPSSDFASRLALLNGPRAGAEALAVKLFAEAPRLESLVLLLHFLAGGREPWSRPDFVHHASDLLEALPTKFPRRKVYDGLLLLLEKGCSATHSLLTGLAAAHTAGHLTKGQSARLRTIATETLVERAHTSGLSALTALAALRPAAALWQRLWESAFTQTRDITDEDVRARHYRDALIRMGACAALNDAIREKLASTPLHDRHLADLAEIAVGRRLRSTYAGLLERLEGYGPGCDWTSFVRVARSLASVGVIDHRWIRAKLRRPAEPVFAVAAWVEAPSKVVGVPALLRRAMRSTARKGAAAVEAMWPLLATWDLRKGHPSVRKVFDAASDEAVAIVLRAARARHSIGEFGRETLRLLCSRNLAIATEAWDDAVLMPSRTRVELARRALERGVLPEIRQRIEAWSRPREPAPEYWVFPEEIFSVLRPEAPAVEEPSTFLSDDDEDVPPDFD